MENTDAAPSSIRSHNAHLSCGFLSEEVRLLRAPQFQPPVFYVRPGPCSRKPERPFVESRRAARKLFEDQGGETLSMCLSGGIDSDCMLQAFVAEKIPFRAYSFRYLRRGLFRRPWNEHDLKDARQLARDYGFKLEFVDADALEYFESGQVFEDSRRFSCSSPQLCLQIRMLSQVPGCPVLAWNAPHFRDGKNELSGLGLPGYKYFAFERAFEEARRPGVAFFFLYTPELLYSFFQLEEFRHPQFAGYAHKIELYNEGGFKATARQDKYTGFEKLRVYFDQRSGQPDEFNRRYRRTLEEELARRSDFPKSEISLIHEDFWPETLG